MSNNGMTAWQWRVIVALVRVVLARETTYDFPGQSLYPEDIAYLKDAANGREK